MHNYADIVAEYDSLTQDASNPAKVSELATIGEQLTTLQPKATLARQILRISQQIQDSEQILTDQSDSDLVQLAKTELTELQVKLTDLENQFSQLLEEETSVDDQLPAIVEFRPGAGGEEAKIWVEDLKRMYLRFAEEEHLKFSKLDENTFLFSGKPQDTNLPRGAYGLFKWESGVHRVQRVPETESQGRVHTSTASVAVLPKVDPSKVEVRDDELEWQFFRSGGKGGQNVNKVSTGVRLIHQPSGITVVSTQERYQQRNREIALDLLRSQLWERQEEERLSKIDTARRSAVGRGMRAEKIRTYNYPQNRVTDHRAGVSWHSLDRIIEGDLTDLLTTLHQQINSDQK